MSNTSFCRTASWKEKVCMSRLICAANIFTLGSTCSPCRTATTTTISPLFFLHERPYKPEALHVPTIFFLFCTRTTNDYANSVSAARGWLVGIPESGWLPVQKCSQDNSWDTAYAVELRPETFRSLLPWHASLWASSQEAFVPPSAEPYPSLKSRHMHCTQTACQHPTRHRMLRNPSG